jgi:polyisoprenoid-binding protein YceI
LRTRNAKSRHWFETPRGIERIVRGMNAPTSATSSSTTPTTATRWTLDPGHSAVGFSVRHLMITNVRGEFEKYRAEVTYDPARPEATGISATIEVGSVNTREARRDSDLRGELFFDAERHPEMTFVSKSARAAGGGSLDVTGDLTIRGTTHEVTLAVREISDVQVDMRGNPRLGATATTKIKRSEFGMTWNKALETGGVVVGDVVTITIDLSLLKAA